ncbi:MAG: bacillithiol biosynthesis deacetylase BshB1 [Ignavibacteria bacterium]
MKLDALFFSAHPDDIELSCGGTVVKLVKMGKKIGVIDLTQGELGTRGSKEIRQKELKNASKIMGIQARENLNLKDGNIEENFKNKLKVISIIRHYKPEIVFLPYYKDRHPDHIHASNLVKESSFYSGLRKINTKRSKQSQAAYRPKKCIFYMQTYTFEPSFIIDITAEFETKMKAVKCYSSQFYNPRSKEPATFISEKKFLEYLEARARFYGFQIGTKYGEPYFVEEKLKLNSENLFGP